MTDFLWTFLPEKSIDRNCVKIYEFRNTTTPNFDIALISPSTFENEISLIRSFNWLAVVIDHRYSEFSFLQNQQHFKSFQIVLPCSNDPPTLFPFSEELYFVSPAPVSKNFYDFQSRLKSKSSIQRMINSSPTIFQSLLKGYRCPHLFRNYPSSSTTNISTPKLISIRQIVKNSEVSVIVSSHLSFLRIIQHFLQFKIFIPKFLCLFIKMNDLN